MSGYDNVTIINEDVLKVDIAEAGRRGKWWSTGKSGGESSVLHHYTNYHGIIREACADREYYRYGAEGSGRSHAGRTGHEGLRCTVAGGAVLCESIYRGKCSAELFYAETEGRLSGDSSDNCMTKPPVEVR